MDKKIEDRAFPLMPDNAGEDQPFDEPGSNILSQ
jgi:hypothetical protein